MTGELTGSERLSALLSQAQEGAADANADVFDDEELAAAAAEDDARRARFDAILATPSARWAEESNPSTLRAALVDVLAEIRGPALDSVGSEGVAAATAPSRKNVPESSTALLPGEVMGSVPEKSNEMDTSFRERAKYVPLRLSAKERKKLRLLEGALNVSQYTDVVDVLSYSRVKTKQRIHSQVVDLCSVLSGLMVASDYGEGQKLIAGRDFAENDVFFQNVFEIGRRHKIANPEKMRSSYGKLVFLLQDSQNDEIAQMLDFSCVMPLRTVGSFLETADGLQVLTDPLMLTATQEIIADGKPRSVIQRQIREKERAVETLTRKYETSRLPGDDIRNCLYSIGDNNAFLRCNRDPCDFLLGALEQYFGPKTESGSGSSLAIRAGRGGARLTHDHSRQYQYCVQSLTLWAAITQHMYQLWYLAEADLFDPVNPYSLRNTGQGLNRVQAAPRVARVMHRILLSVQSRVGSWIGSSVIHLGDAMVPNAFVFIDKYAQLSRILLPLSTVIRRLANIAEEEESIDKYIKDNFGGVEEARKLILRDFFRFAFDGSGGTNSFDSGACVDGRLTSTWNWSQNIEKKSFYPLFLLTGFTGFDGTSFD